MGSGAGEDESELRKVFAMGRGYLGQEHEDSSRKKAGEDWYGGQWEKPSKVVFELKQVGDRVEVKLMQTDVPDEEAKDIDEGWDEYYLKPLKKWVEK